MASSRHFAPHWILSSLSREPDSPNVADSTFSPFPAASPVPPPGIYSAHQARQVQHLDFAPPAPARSFPGTSVGAFSLLSGSSISADTTPVRPVSRPPSPTRPLSATRYAFAGPPEIRGMGPRDPREDPRDGPSGSREITVFRKSAPSEMLIRLLGAPLSPPRPHGTKRKHASPPIPCRLTRVAALSTKSSLS